MNATLAVTPTPRLLMCRAAPFRGHLQHQSLDGPEGLGRRAATRCTPPRRAAMGGAASRAAAAPAPRSRRVEPAARPARSRLHRQRRRRARRQGAAGALSPCRAAARAAGVRGGVPRAAGARPDRRGGRDAATASSLEGAGDCLWDRHARAVLDGLRLPLGRGGRAPWSSAPSAWAASRWRSPIRASITSTPRSARCRAAASSIIPARSRAEALETIERAGRARRAHRARAAPTPRALPPTRCASARVIVLSSCSETLRARAGASAAIRVVDDAARCVPAKRRLGLLPDAAARPPLAARGRRGGAGGSKGGWRGDVTGS